MTVTIVDYAKVRLDGPLLNSIGLVIHTLR